ncbi:MAG: hypothetical protein MK008_05425 [Bdellovibrionales bacterium]|nr:hypothetical protein [Bdellovibrionales bacterium]
MGIELKLIHSKYTPKSWISLPRVGIYLKWMNKSLLATIDKSSLCISLDEAPPSLVRQIKALPKWSYEFDYAGKRLIFKYVPAIEALLTWPEKGRSLKTLMKLFRAQIEEIKPPFTELDQRIENLNQIKSSH